MRSWGTTQGKGSPGSPGSRPPSGLFSPADNTCWKGCRKWDIFLLVRCLGRPSHAETTPSQSTGPTSPLRIVSGRHMAGVGCAGPCPCTHPTLALVNLPCSLPPTCLLGQTGQKQDPETNRSDQVMPWKDSSRTYLSVGQGVSQQPPSNPQIPALHSDILCAPPQPPGPVDLVYNYFWLPWLLLWQRSSGPFTHSKFIYSAPGQARKWQGGGEGRGAGSLASIR